MFKKCFVLFRIAITVYHSIVTSIFLYACPVFCGVPSKLLHKLERFQARAHRIICGRHCPCDSFPSMSDRFLHAGIKFFKYCENHQNHPLHHLVPTRLPRSNHLCMPHCNSTRRLRSFFPWFCVELNQLGGIL